MKIRALIGIILFIPLLILELISYLVKELSMFLEVILDVIHRWAEKENLWFKK